MSSRANFSSVLFARASVSYVLLFDVAGRWAKFQLHELVSNPNSDGLRRSSIAFVNSCELRANLAHGLRISLLSGVSGQAGKKPGKSWSCLRRGHLVRHCYRTNQKNRKNRMGLLDCASMLSPEPSRLIFRLLELLCMLQFWPPLSKVQPSKLHIIYPRREVNNIPTPDQTMDQVHCWPSRLFCEIPTASTTSKRPAVHSIAVMFHNDSRCANAR